MVSAPRRPGAGPAKAQTDGWSSAVALIPLIAGGLLLIGFVVLQKVDRHPLLPLRVRADRNRGAAYLTLLLGQAGVFALLLFLTYCSRACWATRRSRPASRSCR